MQDFSLTKEWVVVPITWPSDSFLDKVNHERKLNKWCNKHCRGQWFPHMNHETGVVEYHFDRSKEAMFFKLAVA